MTRKPPPVARRHLTIEESADYWQLSTKTIRRYVAEGYLTAYRVGPRAIRLDRAEVENLARRLASAAIPAD